VIRFSLALCLAVLLPARIHPAPEIRPGDILFQDSHSSQSLAIKLATHSKFSHCGIALQHQGRLMVLEAVQPVRWTSPEDWIARGQDGYFEVMRLKESSRMNAPALKKIAGAVEKFVGRNYDYYFGWNDSRIYCSELVWKAYARGLGIRLSKPKTLRHFDLSRQAVRDKLIERYGSKIPWDEPMVSPEDIYQSDLLMRIE
jgi:hypothetical protein